MADRIGHRVIVMLCGLTLSIMAGTGFAAVNLLANPSFDSSLAGWTVLSDYPASWSPVDAGGNANSGSALIVNDMNPSNGFVPLVLAQCVIVTPLAGYSFGGRLMIPAGQPADTRAQLWAVSYYSGDCSGSVVSTAQEHGATVGQWGTVDRSFTTLAGVHSIRVTLGVWKPEGVRATAAAHFDNLFLQSGGGNPFAIGPWMSASWYNPAQAGHGITVELLDSARAWMCWFTFDAAGNRTWICSLGSVGGVTIDFADAFIVEGGRFPPLFDPQTIVEVPWGRIVVTFTGCDSGTMTWSTTAPGFQSGAMPLSRLTSLWGNVCPQ